MHGNGIGSLQYDPRFAGNSSPSSRLHTHNTNRTSGVGSSVGGGTAAAIAAASAPHITSSYHDSPKLSSYNHGMFCLCFVFLFFLFFILFCQGHM